MSFPPEPCEQNAFLVEHVTLLRQSLVHWTGRDLSAPAGGPGPETALTPEQAARAVYESPAVVLSHGPGPDPMLTYANRAGLDLFELTWAELTTMPSRLTAEAPERAERERLLARVAAHGYIDDYAGVRISRSGRRFRIRGATVWNLIDAHGRQLGQAATFADWEPL